MKKIYCLLLILSISIGNSLSAQLEAGDDGRGINRISLSEYKDISIDGVKRTEIEDTYGNTSEMTTLLNGNFIVTTETEPDKAINLKDSTKGLFFSFVDHSDIGDNNELIYFRISNSQSSISINGTTFKVGDNISILGDVRVNENDSTITFNTATESSNVVIKFQKFTNKILSITYEVFT